MLFITGSTGFIGRHLIKALMGKGYNLRCLVRTKEGADFCKAMGFQFHIGDITDKESIKGALEDVSMVAHLVGIISEKGRQTFKEVHLRGTENLLNESKKEGIKHFFFQSALGADPNSWAVYLKTKAIAEELVRESGIPFTIFRTSLVIGSEDGFTQKIKGIISSLSPFIPIPGHGDTRFQPLYVEDWVRCFMKIIDNPEYRGKIYELGGPQHLTYKEMVTAIRDAMGSAKPIIHIPPALVKVSASLLGIATAEQIRLLNVDNITELQSVKKNFGFEPLGFKEALRQGSLVF